MQAPRIPRDQSLTNGTAEQFPKFPIVKYWQYNYIFLVLAIALL